MDFLLTSNDSSFNEQLSRIFIRAVENRVTDPFPGKNSQARSTRPKLLKNSMARRSTGEMTDLASHAGNFHIFLYPKKVPTPEPETLIGRSTSTTMRRTKRFSLGTPPNRKLDHIGHITASVMSAAFALREDDEQFVKLQQLRIEVRCQSRTGHNADNASHASLTFLGEYGDPVSSGSSPWQAQFGSK
jgi:hypothetical protein